MTSPATPTLAPATVQTSPPHSPTRLPHAGFGFMREGLRLVIGRAFREVGLHRLEANIQSGNRRSIALVEGLGFTREGNARGFLKIGNRWRDHERWALLKEEWRSR